MLGAFFPIPMAHEVRLARLALFQPDARSGARLAAALGSVHDLVQCGSWEELVDALASDDFEGCLIDADHPSLDEALPRIERLRKRHPDVALVGFTEREEPLDYYRLGTSGLEGFVSGTDGPLTTRGAVDQALALRRGSVVTRSLEGHVADPAPDALGWAVAHAGSEMTVDELASALGSSLSALRVALRERALPTAAAFLLWGRLVAAAARLHRDRRGVEETAFALGYASGPSLARATRIHVGATPGELSERGPEHVLDAFVAHVGGRPLRRHSGPRTRSSNQANRKARHE
jgi:AraC-like DNA-binding protein